MITIAKQTTHGILARGISTVLILLTLGTVFPTAALAANYFHTGRNAESSDTIQAVSADGATAVGTGSLIPVYKWTAEEGKIELPAGDPASFRAAVSGDGSVVAAKSRNALRRWTENGMEELEWPTDKNGGGVESMSLDGEAMAGHMPGLNGSTAFRWTAQAGFQFLGALPGFDQSWANDISGDGTLVVGFVFSGESYSPDVSRPFMWSVDDGMVDLGLAPSMENAYAEAISSDGRVVVGNDSERTTAFRWTAESGMVQLSGLRGKPGGVLVQRTSGDGAVIVGSAGINSGLDTEVAVVWDEAHGWREIRKVLLDEHGFERSQLRQRLGRARDISDDGSVIVGMTAFDGDRRSEGWVLQLDRPINWVVGDADHDLDVDFADFLALSSGFGQPGSWEQGDFDVSGEVDFADFLLLSGNFGFQPMHSFDTTASVPEPTAASLLLIGVIGILRFRTAVRRSIGVVHA